MVATIALDSMTVNNAIQWCQEHHIDISFRLTVKGDTSSASFQTQEIRNVDNFLKVVEDMKRRHRKAAMPTEGTVCDTPLEELSFNGRNCEGRIQRLLSVLGVETVGELLAWAADKPRGLKQITDYPNIGKRTLQVLTTTLKEEGIERIPLDSKEDRCHPMRNDHRPLK